MRITTSADMLRISICPEPKTPIRSMLPIVNMSGLRLAGRKWN
jgi:hypothetical protein